MYTNLYPLPWEPGRASFNRQQFHFLADNFDISVKVPVAWTQLLAPKAKKQVESVPDDKLSTHYFAYFFIPKIMRWSYGITQFISALSLIPELKGKNKPELILATWAFPDAMAAMLLGKVLKIPVLVKVHGSDINENSLITGVKCQIAWVFKRAAGVICVSQDLADKVKRLGASPETTQLVYNGVDTTKFLPQSQLQCRQQLKLNSDQKIILYVGNLKPAKGCVDLLEAFVQLNKQQAETVLVYVGSGACEQQIKQRALQLQLNEQVLLAGSRPHDSLPMWMNAADVVTLPSHNEGVPNVLLEAMACGKPVVATRVGGIPEIVPDFAGLLVEKQEPESLSDALQQALIQTWDKSRISGHAKQFTWDNNISQITQMIEQAIEKSNA